MSANVAREGPCADMGSDIPCSPYRVLDLFSGIGGFSLGLERAGFETVAFCEISPKCRRLLAHHWPEVPIYDDVQTLTAERLAADGVGVDAICGGFPCQDISLAGAGAGLAGARSGLWFEIARLLCELRDRGRPARIVILENVSALLGRGLGTVLGDLAALGYDAEWDCIPASAVGAPHRRDRIWIVAHARGFQHQGYGDAFRRALAAELSAPHAAGGGDGRDGQRPVEVADPVGEGLADASRVLAGRSQQWAKRERARAGRKPITLANTLCGRHGPAIGAHGWWLAEPDVGRVAHGVPARVDRLHGLGNAVVPEIPYRLGRAILAARDIGARVAPETDQSNDPSTPILRERALNGR